MTTSMESSSPDIRDTAAEGDQGGDAGALADDRAEKQRIVSPRAGMFDLESSGPSTPSATEGGSGETPDRTAEGPADEEVELEWNYPVIIATVAVVVILVVIAALVLL